MCRIQLKQDLDAAAPSYLAETMYASLIQNEVGQWGGVLHERGWEHLWLRQ